MGNKQSNMTRIVPLEGEIIYANEENTIQIRKHTPIRNLIVESVTRLGLRSAESSSIPTFLNENDIPDFYIDNTELTQNDYFIAQRSWDMILNNEIPLFHKYKREKKIDNTDSLNWFYDVFFELLYANIASDLYEEANRLFKHNIKIQSRALAQIIKNSLIMTRNEANENRSAEFFECMYKSHKHIELSFKTHIAIAEILVKTFAFCFDEGYENVTFTWQKIMSFSVDRIAPFYRNDHSDKEVKSSNNSIRCNRNCSNLCSI